MGELVDLVSGAIERQDWDLVLASGARLYGAVQSSGLWALADWVDDVMAVALLILEHPAFECVSVVLARVMLERLNGWLLERGEVR